MEIIIQAHNAVVSQGLRERADRAVRRIATRMRRAVDAVVRFEQDGPVRRVEMTLRAAGRRPLVAEGHADGFGPALVAAAGRVERQLVHRKRTRKDRAREAPRG